VKVLGLDTATAMTGVAVVDDQRVLCEFRIRTEFAHAENLLKLIDRALSETGLEPGRLDGISVAIGPGLFTGLRVAVSTVKGLLSGSPLPVFPVSTLEAMAWALPTAPYPVCPMLDARKGEVYTALFQFEESGELKRLMEDRVATVEGLLDGIGGTTFFLGECALACRDRIERRLGRSARFVPSIRSECVPSIVAQLGMDRLKKGEGIDCSRLTPVYLRRSDAELNRGNRRKEAGQDEEGTVR
jgi:tRNA threonylcarbamoyladenosine biosynthesis protein TsaB